MSATNPQPTIKALTDECQHHLSDFFENLIKDEERLEKVNKIFLCEPFRIEDCLADFGWFGFGYFKSWVKQSGADKEAGDSASLEYRLRCLDSLGHLDFRKEIYGRLIKATGYLARIWGILDGCEADSIEVKENYVYEVTALLKCMTASFAALEEHEELFQKALGVPEGDSVYEERPKNALEVLDVESFDFEEFRGEDLELDVKMLIVTSE